MGQYDQPALFTFVLARTKVQNVTYIGHSQGTAQMFAALSTNCDFFKDKINLAVMLAPITRICNLNAKLIQTIKHIDALVPIVEAIGPELEPEPRVQSSLS